MDRNLVTKLKELNNSFYSKTSTHFDESRQVPWHGWETLVGKISKSKLKIQNCVDVGSGNGRFGIFLNQNFPGVKYVGVDFNKELLEFSKEKLRENSVDFKLIQSDVLEDFEKGLNSKFDLVVAFGVLHHIPGFENRKSFIKKLTELVSPEGLVVVTAWQFLTLTRFNRMPEQTEVLKQLEIDPTQLEENDFILDWQRGVEAFRYCHFTDEKEFKSLLPDGFEITHSYLADGKTNDVNKYYLVGSQ